MFRGHHRRVRLLFGASDAFLIAVAFQLAYWTRTRMQLENEFFLTRVESTALLAVSAVAWVTAAAWWEIYDHIELAHPRVILRDAFRQCLVSAASVVLIEYILRLDLSRSFVALLAVWTWFLLCLFRLNASRMLGMFRREFGHPQNVMIVGTGEGALRTGRQLEETANSYARLTGFFADRESEDRAAIELRHTYPLHALADLPGLLRHHVVDEIVFATDSRRLAGLEEVFLLCDEEGIRTRVAVDFFPHVNSTVSLDRFGATPLLTFSAAPYDEVRLLLKRSLDIALGLAGMAVLAPFMGIIAILIRAT